MANVISSYKYAEQLCKALGIDTSKAKARRIVIDVCADQPVKVYVELFGTDALLDVQLPTSDIEIVSHG